MSWRGIAFVFLAIVIAAVWLVAGTPLAMAESSSWFSRAAPEPAPPAKATPQSTGEAPTSSTNTSILQKTIPSIVPATGDDAAYTAFDQGQYLTALKLAEEAANRGEPQAYTLMGRIYADGLGVKKDDAKAAEYYRRAAQMGDVQGTFALGLIYAEGRGVQKDRRAAAELFEKAALTGHAEANYNLGLLFLKGDGKPENPIRAYQHIRYAAEKGLPQAQYDLAALYQAGKGVDPDALEAARWMSRAAAQGYTVAQYEYAILLLKGMGLKVDEAKAVPLMKQAAEKGVPGAQNRMAYILRDGVAGVAKDPLEAAKWRLVAKRNGVEDKELDEMVAKLPKSQRHKAEVAASEWADRIRVDPMLAAGP